jgi:hypothetical protein
MAGGLPKDLAQAYYSRPYPVARFQHDGGGIRAVLRKSGPAVHMSGTGELGIEAGDRLLLDVRAQELEMGEAEFGRAQSRLHEGS